MTSPTALLYDRYYHIYNRGINRENIFWEERNYGYFLELYGKYILPVADTFSYCLLRNHFHVLVRVRTQDETGKNPSKQFSSLFNAYAKAINKAYDRTGSLFQHPFGRVVIANDRQFWNVIVYIHQNPQKHKFVDDFRDWKWSSYGEIPTDKPTHIHRDTVLDWFGGKDQYRAFHQERLFGSQTSWFVEDDEDQS